MERFPTPEPEKKKGFKGWKRLLGIGATALGAAGIGKALESPNPAIELEPDPTIEAAAEPAPEISTSKPLLEGKGKKRAESPALTPVEGRMVSQEQTISADTQKAIEDIAQLGAPRTIIDVVESLLRDTKFKSDYETAQKQEKAERRLQDFLDNLYEILAENLKDETDLDKRAHIHSTWTRVTGVLRNKGYTLKVPELTR